MPGLFAALRWLFANGGQLKAIVGSPKKSFMNYHQLGKSDLQISEIGFGCMSLKGTGAENEKILQEDLELGITLFDTADLYDKGMNEVLVGNAFKQKRNQVILATKVGNQWRADGSGWD